ncbi:MAG: nuclease-related domain-containing protein [Verrucomicrobiales bacterium]|nr:nuclease-related domain-containing protein [Verrucomicrobiales bacterium]
MNTPLWFFLLFPGLPFLAFAFFMNRIAKNRHAAQQPVYSMRRPAGYSLQREANELWDEFSLWLSISVFAALIPALMSIASEGGFLAGSIILGTAVCSFTFWKMWKAYAPLPGYWLGVRGEQATGGELDMLQSEMVRVFHDLVITEKGSTWNIDHVILTRCGLIAIETKARRKKMDVDGKAHALSSDGVRVDFPDGTYDTESISQALRNGKWLSRIATEWTGGDDIPVIAVVAYPGWLVNHRDEGQVYVRNPKEIREMLEFQPHRLYEKNWNILCGQLEKVCRVEFNDPKPKRKLMPQAATKLPHHDVKHLTPVKEEAKNAVPEEEEAVAS